MERRQAKFAPKEKERDKKFLKNDVTARQLKGGEKGENARPGPSKNFATPNTTLIKFKGVKAPRVFRVSPQCEKKKKEKVEREIGEKRNTRGKTLRRSISLKAGPSRRNLKV